MKRDIFTLAHIAKLYYIDKVKQNVIAEKLGITPMMVSRYLKEAEKVGIVEINVKMPMESDLLLGARIKEKYKLNECVVLECDEEEDIQATLGRYLAQYFASILRDNMIIGISWGRAIGKFVEALPSLSVSGCEVVPLSGAFVNKDYQRTPGGIMNHLTRKLNAQIYSTNAPLYTARKETKKELMEDSTNIIMREKAQRTDINIIGIGIIDESNLIFQHEILGMEDFKELKEKKAVGDVGGNYVDKFGVPVKWSKSECYTGISLEEIKKAKEVICVAGGEEKAEIAKAAMKKSYFKTLIIDKKLALKLL